MYATPTTILAKTKQNTQNEKMLMVKYFIPEDGDDEEHPNVFSIRVHNEKLELNLRELKKSFPLPGSYHFRFLTTIGAYTAWLDILNDEDIVPLYNGGYFCKVSRATNILFRDSSISNHGASNMSKEKISSVVHNDRASPPRVVAKPAKPVPNPNLPFATSSTLSAKPAPAPAEKLLRFDDDDGGDDDFTAFASSPAAATTAPSALLEEDLLGMDTTANLTGSNSFQSAAATPRATASAVDLLGLDALQPTPVAISATAPMRPQRTATSTLPAAQSPIPPGRSNPAINVMGGTSNQNSAAQSNLRGMGMGMGSGSAGNLNSLAMGGAGRGGTASMSMNGGRLGQSQGAYDPFNDLTGLNPPTTSNSGATNRAAQPQQRR